MTVPKRRGLALTIIGAILIVIISPAAVGIGIWQGVSSGVSRINTQAWVSPGGPVQITELTSRTILVEGNFPTDDLLPRCAVTDPRGLPVPVDRGTERQTVDWAGTTLTRTGTFQPTVVGRYTVDCPDRRAKVLDSTLANDIARQLLLPIGLGIGLAGLACLVGLIMLIVGIVKLVNSGRERSTARLAASGGYPGPYGGGPSAYGPPPGYQPPPPGQQPGNPNDPYRR